MSSSDTHQPTINLNLYATLSCYRPDDRADYPINSGMPVAELLNQLSIPVAIAVSVFVNGETVARSYKLRGKEKVKIFPIMGGG